MKSKLFAITVPGIDLRAFKPIVGENSVNNIDAKNLQPMAKFAALVDSILYKDTGYSHIYQAFYFELPPEDFAEMMNSPVNLKVSLIEDIRGIVSASFADWKIFLKWALSKERSLEIQQLGNVFLIYFRSFNYFQNL